MEDIHAQPITIVLIHIDWLVNLLLFTSNVILNYKVYNWQKKKENEGFRLQLLKFDEGGVESTSVLSAVNVFQSILKAIRDEHELIRYKCN